MKNKYRYSLVLLLLCFSFKAQAQQVIALETRLTQLPTVEAEKIISLIYESPSSMFVTETGQATTYEGSEEEIVEMSIRKKTDFFTLQRVFPQYLKEVVLVNIQWDGSENMMVPPGMFQQMKGLKYVYICSYSDLDPVVIQTSFSKLIEALQDKKEVEVLYYTMKSPR